MPSVAENRDYWNSYSWAESGHEWSGAWGNSANMWAATILPRIGGWLPCRRILEIAPGYGRVTQFLIRQCDQLTIVDLVPKCVRACKQRLKGQGKLKGYVNDGRSLKMIKDGAYDFVISWDSLVHVESDVMREYVLQLGRKLRPGGAGFLHHSNIGAYMGEGGKLTVENPHWRAQSMSATLFRRFAQEAGLVVLGQELIPWGCDVFNDCFSGFMRPPAGTPAPPTSAAPEPKVVENTAFWDEAWRIRPVAELYASPFASSSPALAAANGKHG